MYGAMWKGKFGEQGLLMVGFILTYNYLWVEAVEQT